jgi:hypothetical protein
LVEHYSFGVDIGQFYDADDRRRQSVEIELGTEWRDAQAVRYELNWIEDTGELYVMVEPPPPVWEDPFGDIYVQTNEKAPITGMTVRVIAHMDSHDRLEQVLEGWQAAMAEPDGIHWLADRLKAQGVADPSWAGGST